MTPEELMEKYGRVRLTVITAQGKRSLFLQELNEALKIIGFYKSQGDRIKIW